MTMTDFCAITLQEYQLKCKGYRMKDAHEWNRTRNIMWAIFVSVAGKKGPKSPAEILKIPLLDKTQENSLIAAHYRLKARLMAEQLQSNGGTG